ncbi:hypothetical protein CKM354_001007900 [Cercospora kikuchii]|uniref:Apple domain-containing protein n=1 Tax=Cercospora kikuchii TaxID=84275 RepID=A0A9P3CPJ0_9PEZI|nr:uncharacterized protein CKM354_001007900 [Cercospora kikuchii]GIZ46977.1 hypothetical protein CKM354_001007900 [Cercospora kikuchii]
MRRRHSLFFQAFAFFFTHAVAQTTNNFTCPAANNTFVTDINGGQYRIACGSDPNPDGGTNTLVVADWNGCFNGCSRNATCTAFAYNGVANGAGNGTCTFKARNPNRGNTLRNRDWDPTYIGAVRQITSAYNPTCPAIDGTYVTDTSGAQYLVSCNSDTPSPEGSSGTTTVPNFNECFNRCSREPTCVAWTYRGPAIGPGSCAQKTNETGGITFIPSTDRFISGIRLAAVPPTSSDNYNCSSGGTTYTDASGVAYVTSCENEALPIAATSQQPGSSANDCWATCSSNVACTGWTFRATDAVSPTAGAGTCFYKGANAGGVGNGFYTRNNTLMISAIKAANYDPAQNRPRLNNFACPDVNGTIVTDADGSQYRMKCGDDTNPADTALTLFQTTANTFNGCFTSCTANSSCAAFTWNQVPTGNGICFFKPAPAGFRNGPYNAALVAAVRVAPSTTTNFTCPAVDGTVVTAFDGTQYRMKCGVDALPAGAAWTIYRTSVTDFNQCFASCSANATCDGFAYSGGTNGVGDGTCNFKGAPGGFRTTTTYNAGLVAAVRYVPGNNYTCTVGQRTLYSDLTGTTWITSCGDDTNLGSGINVSNKETSDGVNDCWASCAAAQRCVGFSFQGSDGVNYGTGLGQCYFKSANTDGSPTTFVAANNPRYVSSVKLANYAPLTSSYTCPTQQDLSTVTDANTGLPYVLRCGGDTAGTAFATFNATSGFNDCITQCTSDTRCTTWTYNGATNGAGPGTCALKSGNSTGFTSATGAGSQNRVAGIQQRAYDGSNGAIAATTVFPPAATQVATQIILVTTTILQPVPTTILSTISRLTTITSSVTVTATNVATLPDTTLRVTSAQVVPTTFVTLQAITITVSTITTQTIVTVVPTTIVQTLSAATTNLLATGINTATTTLRAVVTVTPVQSVQPTYTVTG